MKEYKISKSELFYITNKILSKWFVIFPFNFRWKMQKELEKRLEKYEIK